MSDRKPSAPEALERAAEAVLFACGGPLSTGRVAEALGCSAADAESALRALSDRLIESGSALRLERVAGGWQLLTLPEYHPFIERVRKASQPKLSRSAMETLSVIAYRQPVRRSVIEAVRGVACGDAIKQLTEAGLVRVTGREGRALLYGTTRRFLQVFGLRSLKDLPEPDTDA